MTTLLTAPPCRHTPRASGCPACWHWTNTPGMRELWSGVPPAPRSAGPRIALCLHLGEPTRPASGCADIWRRCEAGHGVVAPCKQCGPARCKDYYPDPDGTPPGPERIVRVPDRQLPRGKSGYAFNASLIRFNGKLLLAHRTDWQGAQIHLTELGEDYAPVGPSHTLYGLESPRASYGREDPRLFEFDGRLHVSYTGVERTAGGKMICNVMYARLSDSFAVEEVFAPVYARRITWEKNWVFFEHDRRLFYVYETAPSHTVLELDGGAVAGVHRTGNPFPWSGGHRRGGASPVLVGDRWYHWFHGRRGSDRRYNVGVAVFEDKPPFRLVAQTPDPLLWAGDPGDNYCPVVFPGGAVLERGIWKIAMGRNDRSIEIAEWDAESVDRALRLK